MKRILILGAGAIQLPVIIKAKELNIYTIVLDYDKEAPGIKFADEFHAISTNETEKILSLSQQLKIDGILTTSDYPVNAVAKVAETLHLPGMSVELAKICTNKYLQREFFNKNNIAVPKYHQIKCESELAHIDFFPCIIKPVDSSASRGVKMVCSAKELLEQYSISKSISKSGSVIIEEFIKGREFSVETLTQENKTEIIQITEKLTIGENNGYFVEDTHITPARISNEDKENIEDIIYYALEKIGVNNCPTHTEIKINENGVFIIEIACRLGGDYITSDLVPLSTGIDMLENLIYLSLNKPIKIERTRNAVAAIQFLNPINYQNCVDFVKKNNPYIVKKEIYPYQKDEIKNSNDRLGYIILNTPDMKTMEDLLTYIK